MDVLIRDITLQIEGNMKGFKNLPLMEYFKNTIQIVKKPKRANEETRPKYFPTLIGKKEISFPLVK